MTERITAWQCIGCGRIEGAQPCVGICQDRKTDFVYAADHDEMLAQLALERRRAEALAALARQLACTTPRKDEWERTYRALQARARLWGRWPATNHPGQRDPRSSKRPRGGRGL